MLTNKDNQPAQEHQFRKKPIVIEAILWDETLPTWQKLTEKGMITYSRSTKMTDVWGLRIKTLEGVTLATKGDWIIKGVNGEFYPCKPDIFEKTYEKTTTQPSKEDHGEEVLEDLKLKIQEILFGNYGCSRVWSAWNVGTMTRDDFFPLDESEEIIESFIDFLHATDHKARCEQRIQDAKIVGRLMNAVGMINISPHPGYFVSVEEIEKKIQEAHRSILNPKQDE